MKPHLVNDVAILAPRGWLMGDNETDQLEAAIRQLLESGNRRLVLDLIDVSHMNSTAIGMLVGCHTSYCNRKGVLKICNAGAKIQSVLVITQLVRVFDLYGSEREAIESFNHVQQQKA